MSRPAWKRNRSPTSTASESSSASRSITRTGSSARCASSGTRVAVTMISSNDSSSRGAAYDRAAAGQSDRHATAQATNASARATNFIGTTPAPCAPACQVGIDRPGQERWGAFVGAGGAQAPPGALRTTVLRQAGLRTYELPCGAWRAPSPSQARRPSGCRSVRAADDVTARLPLRGQRRNDANDYSPREPTSRLTGSQNDPAPDAVHGASRGHPMSSGANAAARHTPHCAHHFLSMLA